MALSADRSGAGVEVICPLASGTAMAGSDSSSAAPSNPPTRNLAPTDATIDFICVSLPGIAGGFPAVECCHESVPAGTITEGRPGVRAAGRQGRAGPAPEGARHQASPETRAGGPQPAGG